MADIIKKDIGAVSAYALAVEGGYTGTEDDFRADMANLAGNVAQVAADKLAAAQSATDADASKTAANAAKAAAEIAKEKAEAAQAAAETAKAGAETAKAEAKTSADNSAASAAAAAGSATEAAQTLASIPPAYNVLVDRVAALEASKIKRYSVRFTGSGAGTREDDAVGMVANVAVNDEVVRNDFDNVSFFERPICNCTWDADNRKWRVNAYKGDPDFAWDGSNGEVMYECKPCAYSDDTDLNAYVSVTGTPREGYTLFSIFPDWNTKIYLPVFNLVMVDGKAGSRAGYFPATGSLNEFDTKAKTFFSEAHTETIEALYYDACLQLVEFATKDVQSVMAGASNHSYNSATTVIASVISTTQFTMATAEANRFVVGQTVAIGSAKNGSNRTPNVVIANIEDSGESGYKKITLETEVSGLAAGDFLSTRMWRTGAAAMAVTNASSGSLASNTDGLHPCIYRGKENPWGNGFSTICNLLIKRNGEGTTENPYSYKLYYLPDISKYANGAITEDYIEIDIELPTSSEYIKLMAKDGVNKEVFAPKSIGGSSSTYWAAYYYVPQYSVCAVRFGGFFNNGRYCGFYFTCSGASSSSGVGYAARLLCNPKRGSGGGSPQLAS